jgi:hypothetical protein
MNIDIKNLISNFNGKNFKEFVAYIYMKFQKEIDLNKKKYDKNKYIKIRQNILQYIIANERLITAEIKKNNK